MSHLEPSAPSVTAPPLAIPQRRVFLGSSSVDLHRWRSRIDQLLPYLGQFSVVMDRFAQRPLGTEDATSVSLDELRSCQVYILLLGWRYGHIPTGETMSVTHLEYREAMSRGLTCFAFLTDPSTQEARGPEDLFPAAVRTPEHQEQLLAFRAEVQQHIVSYFTTIDDLTNTVAAAIFRYLLAEHWHQGAAGTPAPRFLPPRAAGFVGRAPELVTLTQTLLTGQDTGLTALVSGMGGVGKSALAAEAVHRLAQDPTAFPAGMAWVRCDGRTEPRRSGLGLRRAPQQLEYLRSR